MTTMHLADPVAVWLENGLPVRLVWRGKRYTVSDTPTPIRETTGFTGITHPTERLVGWRVQGTESGGDAYVFDVERIGPDSWQLTAYYD